MPVVEVDDSTFQAEVLQSELPVLLDLAADWCGPCKQLAPILDELAQDLDGRLKVARVDVDKSPRVAQAFRVQSIPMLVVIQNGEVKNQAMGLQDKKRLMELVKPVLPVDATSVTPKDLSAMIEAGQALDVDTRHQSAHARHHIPGAICIPLEQLEERKAELEPGDGRLRVLYSRTPEQARDAAQKLRAAYRAEGAAQERGGSD